MLTIKLHEATKEFKISNKLAMFFLEARDLGVKSHSSVITIEQLELLRAFAQNPEAHKDVMDAFHNQEKARRDAKKKVAEASAPEPVKDEPAPQAPVEREQPAAPARAEEPEKHKVQEVAAPAKVVQPPAPAPEEAKPVPAPVLAPVVVEKPAPAVVEPPRHQEPAAGAPVPAKKVEAETPAAPAPSIPEPAKPSEAPATAVPPRPKTIERPGAKKVEKPADPEEVLEELAERVEGRKPEGDRKPVRKVEEKVTAREKEPLRRPQPASPNARVATHAWSSEKPAGGFNRPGGPGGNRPQGNRGGRWNGDIRRPGEKRPPLRREAPKVTTKPRKEEVYDLPEMIQIPDAITLREFADSLGVKLRIVEEKALEIGIAVQTNDLMVPGDVERLCEALGVAVDLTSFEEHSFQAAVERHGAELEPRGPVVAFMGHVDHGKTTLLDHLRKTRVAEGEAGGITQSIGAYRLKVGSKDVVFIDTPGHEAFTNLRARGARVTDIVILVVAANDGVQPQTVEAINHARAAGVPIIVAINKIDLPGADSNKVKQALSRYNVLVEDWGGDVVAVEISAKFGKNLEQLLEMVHLVAEMQELKSYRSVPAKGTVIEARMDSRLGPVGTVLIEHGRLRRGDDFICGNSLGRVKSLFNDNGETIQDALAPLPVEVMGFNSLPEAGDRFQVIEDVDKARRVIDRRLMEQKDARQDESPVGKKMNIQSLFQKLEEGDRQKAFPYLIKTDNFGSGEVLEALLKKQEQEQIRIDIIHKGIGNLTESDILLAATTGAIALGFNVKAPQKVLALAKREGVEIKLYNVIYHLIEDIEKAIRGEIVPEYEEQRIGTVEVLQKFKISRIGIVAGCVVRDGKVTNKSRIKVTRGTDLVFEGQLETLRRHKDEVSEVRGGTECGIRVKNFNDIETGDILEIYDLVEKK